MLTQSLLAALQEWMEKMATVEQVRSMSQMFLLGQNIRG